MKASFIIWPAHDAVDRDKVVNRFIHIVICVIGVRNPVWQAVSSFYSHEYVYFRRYQKLSLPEGEP